MKALTGESSGRKSRKRKVFLTYNQDAKDYFGRKDLKRPDSTHASLNIF